MTVSLLNDEQMSNKVRVEHQPDSSNLEFPSFQCNQEPSTDETGFAQEVWKYSRTFAYDAHAWEAACFIKKSPR